MKLKTCESFKGWQGGVPRQKNGGICINIFPAKRERKFLNNNTRRSCRREDLQKIRKEENFEIAKPKEENQRVLRKREKFNFFEKNEGCWTGVRCLAQLAVPSPDRQPSANINGSKKWFLYFRVFLFLHFCNSVFLYFFAHDPLICMAQLAVPSAQTDSRQQISKDQKFMPPEKKFLQRTGTKPKQFDKNIFTFLTFGWGQRWERGNIFSIHKLFHDMNWEPEKCLNNSYLIAHPHPREMLTN